MVETESQRNPINPEVVKLDKIVGLLGKVGYEYEMRASHEDLEGDFHFKREFQGRLYPHFHFIYKPSQDRIKLHLDERKHVTKKVSAEVSREQERLAAFFQSIGESSDVQIIKFANDCKKQLMEASLFRVSNYLSAGDKPNSRLVRHRSLNNKNKLRKNKKTRLH